MSIKKVLESPAGEKPKRRRTSASKSELSIKKKIIRIQDGMNSLFYHMEREISAAILTLLTGETMIIVGEPGTAKTLMINTLARYVDGNFFFYQLSQFTKPEELLGPVDIPSLREGTLRRITRNRLPEADIAFLDEIFKASVAIRNYLLDIILFKRVMDGGEYMKIPLLALYTSSNEISEDEEDAAFYDRLLIRVFQRFAEDEKGMTEIIIRGARLEAVNIEIEPIMTISDVREAQGLVLSHMRE
ncbi:MAG: hypothetical protein DRN78_00095, partial [Thermoproteota archaeon]